LKPSHGRKRAGVDDAREDFYCRESVHLALHRISKIVPFPIGIRSRISFSAMISNSQAELLGCVSKLDFAACRDRLKIAWLF